MNQEKVESQFHLLGKKRFLPLFLTQFLGALNDNVFKNALIFLIVFNAAGNPQFGALPTDALVNIASGLFIIPFVLFSVIAGQLSDKFDKASVIRKIKLFEVVVMLFGAFSLYTGNIIFLLSCLFLMGSQSALFGPAKYSILPQHLTPDELVGGNALVETGTFLAILIGTLMGGLLSTTEQAITWISAAVVAFAVLGYFTSRFIPTAPSYGDDTKINWNLYAEIKQMVTNTRRKHSVFLAILAISWFWFVGASYLAQIPSLVKQTFNGTEEIVTFLLLAFSIGVGIGSLVCEKMSGHKIEVGIIPIGSIGITVFGLDLYFSANHFAGLNETTLLASSFIYSWEGIRVLLDVLGIGFFGGIFIVPLYTYIQNESEESERGQIIASNNVFNALFMAVSAVLGATLIGYYNLSVVDFFLVIALMNILVAGYIYHQVPEFTTRFMIYLLTHTMYRVRVKHLNRIPKEGAAVLVANHVSYVDALLLSSVAKRPIRFVMYKPIYDLPVLNYIFKAAKAIPIISGFQDPEVLKAAYDEIAQALENGELVCIFPEGKLTKDGEMNEFKQGIEKIIERTPVPVVPAALKGLWGSFFSHKDGKALQKLPRRFWSSVEIEIADPIPADHVSASMLHERVLALRGDRR